jgi:hypothetical protein
MVTAGLSAYGPVRQGKGRAAMPKIFTTCLVTGQLIDTRIEIDETSIAGLAAFVGKVFCPHCGSEHEWSKDTARFVNGDKPKSSQTAAP